MQSAQEARGERAAEREREGREREERVHGKRRNKRDRRSRITRWMREGESINDHLSRRGEDGKKVICRMHR